MVDAIVEGLRRQRLTVDALLAACSREDLLAMRMSAGLDDEALRETVPEMLRYQIARSFQHAVRESPLPRPAPAAGSASTPESLACEAVHAMRLKRFPDAPYAVLAAPPTRTELLDIAVDMSNHVEVRRGAATLAQRAPREHKPALRRTVAALAQRAPVELQPASPDRRERKRKSKAPFDEAEVRRREWNRKAREAALEVRARTPGIDRAALDAKPTKDELLAVAVDEKLPPELREAATRQAANAPRG